MADTKLSDLTELAAEPAGADEFYLNDGGTSKKITWTNMSAPFATYGIMSVQAGAAGESTVDATPRQITAWNTNGPSNGVTVDHTDDSIAVTIAATYEVRASISFSGSNSKTYQLEVYKFDTTASPQAYAATGFALDRKLGSGGDVGSAGLSAIVSMAAGDKVAIFQSTSDGGSAMTITEAQLFIHRVSV